MVAIALPAIAFLAIPTVVILLALLVFAVAEWIFYLPLRLFSRNKTKAVNRPGLDELLRT